MRIILPLLAILLVAACSRKEEQAADNPAPAKPPSTMRTAVDGFTGKTAVKQGKMAQEKLIQVSDKKNSELDEVLQ